MILGGIQQRVMIPPEISKIENEVGNYTHNIVFKDGYLILYEVSMYLKRKHKYNVDFLCKMEQLTS